MDVGTTTWQLAGDGADTSLVMQNVGVTRIAYVYAASQPAADAYDLDTDDHFVLLPGTPPVTITGLDTYSKNVYVRSLGSKQGQLAVEANTTP